MEHAHRHLRRRYQSTLSRTAAGDTSSGFVGFTPDDEGVDWNHFSVREDGALAWLHIPSLAGSSDSGTDEWSLAKGLFEGDVQASELGAPFAAIRWSPGKLEIANDVLGLVRLFHYSFDSGDVWTTRMGLAHVFMGEAPVRNALAWQGMATIGWAPGGSTQLGSGRQVAGASRVVVRTGAHGTIVDAQNELGQWLNDAKTGPEPSAATNVSDMEQLMTTAKRWPVPAISDLSGGKDSRLIAAIGILSRSIKSVRTIANDTGEVATAQALMASIDTDIEHMIVQKPNRSSVAGDGVFHRLATQHEAFEGRYLPATAFHAAAFAGFKSPKQARFNGLGGEVMNGGSFTRGTWGKRLDGAPLSRAGDRIASLVSNGSLGVSTQAIESVNDFAHEYPAIIAEASGIDTPNGVLDLFYNTDRMPNWSNVFAETDKVCPLFASSILSLGARNIGSPVPDGELHKKFLSEAMPSWLDVPFYKATGTSKRVLPMVWENPDWMQIRRYILQNADRLESFSADGLSSIVRDIDDTREVSSRHEVAIHRFLWNATFDSYEADIVTAATEVRTALSSA